MVATARSSDDSRGRLPGTIEATAALVRAEGAARSPVALDVRDEEAVATLADRVYDEFGRCDLVVNNAALAPPKPALEDSTKRWRLGVDVNVNGPFYFTYYFAPRMAPAGDGRIVNISSGASQAPELRARQLHHHQGRARGDDAARSPTTSRGSASPSTASASSCRSGPRASPTRCRPDVDIPFEDAVIMSDALLWFARQPLDVTGEVLTIVELRERGAVRGFTPAQRT